MRQFLRCGGIVVALGTLTAGCDDPDESKDVQFRPYNCPTWQCGFNSAEINGRSIRELNLDGLANDDGMQIVGFQAPAGSPGSFSLDVEDDALVARGPGGVTLRGAALIGAKIFVKRAGQPGPKQLIKILGYEEVTSWAADAPVVATYTLLYPDVEAILGVRSVCNPDPLDSLVSAVTVLGGETYDLETKTVHPDRPRWLTLACAGSAAAKMRLMNYGPQSDFDGAGNPATVAQRQATLKMLTADYCGDGHSYTENGTPLKWENHGGTVVSPGSFGAPEAIWSAAGALCLDATRLEGAQLSCTRPSCAELSLDDGEWATYVPG